MKQEATDVDGQGESAAMDAEFDTVAAWTADVALDLGPEHHVPAGCRGSGGPAALHWFLDRLAPEPRATFLDVGAGVGGPAGFAAQEAGVRPVLTEPQAGACRAARRLFGVPVVQAGSALPVRDASVDVGWCLGVLCTVADQPAFVAELRRVLAPGARLGLLVYVAERADVADAPEGNHFPTADGLARLLDGAGLDVEDSAHLADFAGTPALWQERADAVDAELERRHGDDPRWRTAEEQSGRIGRLIASGEVRGTMLVVRPRPVRTSRPA
ncbi:class I SAM-dependent methyltransferase [Microlunatus flavus]|uniref:Methyltransferase domain-containing protein n=1 Tax=Microlunatus flavus TaxID=1036181 RepID=A0A1H9LUF5_9ACTN|nr:methyltransferase domain-containing protein [Microlunatus flavus]SER14857.1 Methyltransferase domain-containing protein [Microlunatus flavus]